MSQKQQRSLHIKGETEIKQQYNKNKKFMQVKSYKIKGKVLRSDFNQPANELASLVSPGSEVQN